MENESTIYLSLMFLRKGVSVNFLGAGVSCLLLAGTWANVYSEPYSCYGDVCNFYSAPQFCDVDYRYCRRCDEIKGDCFTIRQMHNCTEYCYETRYETEVEHLRVAGCQVPPPPEHGRFEGANKHVPFNGTLEITCDEGYELKNKDPFICGDFSVWIGSQPKCEGSTNRTPTLVICLGVLVAMSFVLNIALLTRKYWNRVLSSNKEKQTEHGESSPLMTLNKIDSHTDKQPNGSVYHENERPKDPSAPPEDQFAIDLNEYSASGVPEHIGNSVASLDVDDTHSSGNGINRAEGGRESNVEGTLQHHSSTALPNTHHENSSGLNEVSTSSRAQIKDPASRRRQSQEPVTPPRGDDTVTSTDGVYSEKLALSKNIISCPTKGY